MQSATAATGKKLHVLLIMMMVLLANMNVAKTSIVKRVDSNDHVTNTSALFVFGDSLLDVGNGIYLHATSSSRSSFGVAFSYPDHLPYGRDFPSHQPSGRYSNGLVLSDILATFLGLPHPPPYFPNKDNILQGTSFAVSGAAIDNHIGFYPFPRQNFHDQVDRFTEVQQRLVSMLGESSASSLLSKSLFLIWMGANDYYGNYNNNPFGKSTAQKKYTPYEFRNMILSLYRTYVERMYDLGARKFAMVSLPPIGCAPVARLLFRSRNDTCISFLNREAQDFNMGLLEMSKQLQAAYPNGHFTFLNSYDEALDIITNPSAHGFLQGTRPCCATGPLGGLPVCRPRISSVCEDASKYVFWDFAHPTEALDMLITKNFITGSSPFVQPYNIKELSRL